MKKIMFFASVCVALVACSKEIDTTTPQIGDGIAFEKGQMVTLAVNTGDRAEASTKVSSELVTSGTDKGKVNFKWETGDKIKISVGTESAEFTLLSGAGTASAIFTGTMPAAGNKFDVQYPVADPDLTSQIYVANALPKDKMKMAATECTLGTPFTLNPQYAALRLNLYGLNREVSQIVVTDTTAKPNVSYTLTCSTVVRVENSATTATPFCIVVPEGSWGFKVDVTSAAATTALEEIPEYNEGLGFSGKGIIIPNKSFSTSSKKSFTAGVILNMPAKPITVIWAPVNCGYKAASGEDKGYTYGRMYQWGRKYGHGYHDFNYEDNDYPGKSDGSQPIVQITKDSELLTSHPDNTFNGNFYSNSSSSGGELTNDKIWYNGADPDKLWNKNEGTGNSVSKSDYDPCPEGWRVPTIAELTTLLGKKTDPDIKSGTHGSSTVKGSTFDGDDGNSDNFVFLPYAGNLTTNGSGNSQRDSKCWYWSSSVNNNRIQILLVGGRLSIKTMIGEEPQRALGQSVRCVKE